MFRCHALSCHCGSSRITYFLGTKAHYTYSNYCFASKNQFHLRGAAPRFRCELTARVFLRSIILGVLDNEDEGTTVVRNVEKYSPNNTAYMAQQVRTFKNMAVRTLNFTN
jgi:hypothetical protein